ncbi:glutaredoxin family protein [Proteobacteria bacterium 005FR1]|nr:glutaredoxin family protein [Proteobacteria bacterium 005FR1]
MKKVFLYSTLGCHLCEHAKAMIAPVAAASGYELEEVEISDSEDLLERYKLTIPVARNAATDEEINWPFSQEQVARLLKAT